MYDLMAESHRIKQSKKKKKTTPNQIEYFGKKKIKGTPWSISMIARIYSKGANGTVLALTEEYMSIYPSLIIQLWT